MKLRYAVSRKDNPSWGIKSINDVLRQIPLATHSPPSTVPHALQSSNLSKYGQPEPLRQQATWLADPKVGWRALLNSMKLGLIQVPAKQMSSSRDGTNRGSALDSHALVILGTPGFARHLGDELNFLRGFLHKLMVRAVDKDVTEVDVVCAYVDGIGFKSPSKYRPREGISVLHGLKSEILPKLWEETIPRNESSETLSSLTFTSMPGGRKVTMPLANTLFTNGRQTTLFISKWRRGVRGEGPFQIHQFASKANQEIRIFENSSRLTIAIRTIPLTPARRIASGLGNIIRQLEFDQEIGPASRELESSLDKYFAVRNKSISIVDVWALIVPADLAPSMVEEMNEDDVKSAWTGDTDATFIGRWIDKGAIFCRLLSGGGGWGIKQGLLSLDPQTAYGTINETQYDYSAQPLQDQQVSALGNLATPGSAIQFFLDDSESGTELLSRLTVRGTRIPRSTVIQTVPSTIDDISNASEELGTPSQNSFEAHPSHFGAASESGLFLETPILDSIAENPASKQHIVSTKIDLPYSCVVQDIASDLVLESAKTRSSNSIEQRNGTALDSATT